jgi:MFS family permease
VAVALRRRALELQDYVMYMLTSQQNRHRIRTLGNSLTLRIILTSVLIFVCYFTIGLQLAVVPGFVHLQLGYNAVLAGLAISAQYVATLLSRPIAGRMGDSVGAKHTTRSGLLVCATSGLFFLWSAWLKDDPLASLCVLLLSRLILGFGESWVATGATIWGIGRVGGAYTAQVISWSGIASYGALAIGAPLGIWLENNLNVGAIGVVSVVAALGGFLWASAIRTIPFNREKVWPSGKCWEKFSRMDSALHWGEWDSARLLLSLRFTMQTGTGKTRDCRSVFSVSPSWPPGCCLRILLISGVDIGSRLCRWRSSAQDLSYFGSLRFQSRPKQALPWPALAFRWYFPPSARRRCGMSPHMTVVRLWAFIPPVWICPWEFPVRWRV